jgi:hypothetical protein
MSPNPESLLTIWTELNHRYFHGALPPISIEWSRRLTSSAGMFVCRVGPRHSIPQTIDERAPRRCIRLSSVLLQDSGPEPERDTIVTLAHEMIHQWQYDILKRRPNHGPDFRRMMARMNQEGLGITLYHSLGTAVAALAKYAWCCQHCGSIYRRHRRSLPRPASRAHRRSTGVAAGIDARSVIRPFGQPAIRPAVPKGISPHVRTMDPPNSFW